MLGLSWLRLRRIGGLTYLCHMGQRRVNAAQRATSRKNVGDGGATTTVISGDPRMKTSLATERTTVSAVSSRVRPPSDNAALSVPMRELLPPASNKAGKFRDHCEYCTF